MTRACFALAPGCRLRLRVCVAGARAFSHREDSFRATARRAGVFRGYRAPSSLTDDAGHSDGKQKHVGRPGRHAEIQNQVRLPPYLVLCTLVCTLARAHARVRACSLVRPPSSLTSSSSSSIFFLLTRYPASMPFSVRATGSTTRCDIETACPEIRGGVAFESLIVISGIRSSRKKALLPSAVSRSVETAATDT